MVNEIAQSDCFSKFMKKRGLIWTNGRTAEQVVAHIRGAALTVPVHYYRGRCSVVGYRSPPEPDVYFNRCSHDYYDACDTASNAFHEWSHSLEYDHPYRSTSTRGLTVPYSLNAAVETCCKQGGHGFRGDGKERL